MFRWGLASLATVALGLFIMLLIEPSTVMVDAQADVAPAEANEVSFDWSELERAFAVEEQAYRQQLSDLALLRMERRVIYEQQADELQQRLAAGQTLLDSLRIEAQNSEQQLSQLSSVQRERQTVLLGQKQVAEAAYAERYIQYQNQIAEVQAKLVEARNSLGQ